MFNLNTYFQRIHFNGTPRADLITLRTLQALHPAYIPFENVDVLVDKGISLQLEHISDKLIDQQRGGYCFEHNTLLMAVLRELGFEVEPLMARALWRLPADAPAGPRTHMVLRTTIDGIPWLVDVGFGGLVLTAPLKMTADLEQPTQHETFRLMACEFGFLLEVNIRQQWQPVYHLGLEPQQPIDLEVANWYTSTHPHSKFRHNLIAARATMDTRYTLLNDRLTIRKQGAKTVHKTLNVDEWMTALAEYFLLPVQPEWRTVYHKAGMKGEQG